MKIQVLLLVVVLPVCAQDLPCFCHFGLVARDNLNVNGNNFSMDSFDSADPTKSTSGLYDAAKRQPNGSIAVGTAFTNLVGSGNADVYGVILTSPTGTVSGVGANGSIGPVFNTQVRATTVAAAEAAGWIRHACGLFMPSVVLPQGVTWMIPTGNGVIGSGDRMINKSYTLNSGDWKIGAVTLNSSQQGDTLTIDGDVRLYVTGIFDISGLGSLVINPGASLTVYIGGNVTVSSYAFINNAGRPENNVWFALDSSTSWSVVGNGTFIGVIYAPNATVHFRGGGATGDASGAIMARNVVLTGSTKFHYDEALHRIDRPWYRVCAGPEFEYEISGIEVSETNAVARFLANAGKTFALQYSDDLSGDQWFSVGSTNDWITSVSCTNEFRDLKHAYSGIISQRFYRLRVQPLF